MDNTKAIEMQPVSSSNIAAVSYNDKAEVAMVRFKNGATYRYEGVTPEDFEALAKADSVGSHFNRVFRVKYSGTKVVEKGESEVGR